MLPVVLLLVLLVLLVVLIAMMIVAAMGLLSMLMAVNGSDSVGAAVQAVVLMNDNDI